MTWLMGAPPCVGFSDRVVPILPALDMMNPVLTLRQTFGDSVNAYGTRTLLWESKYGSCQMHSRHGASEKPSIGMAMEAHERSQHQPEWG